MKNRVQEVILGVFFQSFWLNLGGIWTRRGDFFGRHFLESFLVLKKRHPGRKGEKKYKRVGPWALPGEGYREGFLGSFWNFLQGI